MSYKLQNNIEIYVIIKAYPIEIVTDWWYNLGTKSIREAVIMKVGYIRTSTAEQNIARQEVLMQDLGVEKVYVDQLSGKNTERPQLQAMLNYVREGDTVIVESISRFARNTKDLLELVEQLKEKKVIFVSKKETIDTNTPSGQFMLTVFGAMAQLERDYILDRQREGIAVAKAFVSTSIGCLPLYTPAAFATAIPSRWRSNI